MADNNKENTPSPVRAVRQFEADCAKAAAMQQLFDDEAHAARVEEEGKIEDEFDAATRALNEERSQKVLKKYAEEQPADQAAARPVMSMQASP